MITTFIAFTSIVVTLYGQFKISKLNREFELLKIKEREKAEKELQNYKYREPLIRAAADLQSRIYNILKLGFFNYNYINGDDRQRNYAINNTIFLFFQFFAWTEAVRRDIQFISLDEDYKTGKLSELQNSIYSIMQTNKYESALMVFAGEQRALGEIMLKSQDGRAMCIGYGEFLKSEFKKSDPLVLALTTDLISVAEGLKNANERLKQLQNVLIDLLTFLDPECIRFPKQERSKII